MQRRFPSFLLLMALLLTGCVSPLSDLPDGGEKGDLTITFRATPFQRATTKGLEEGDIIQNLLVIVTTEDGTIVSNGKVFNNNINQNQADVTFNNLSVGNYFVYALANITETDWLGYDAQGISSAADAEARLLKTLSSTLTPSEIPAGKPMLLTGFGELPVGVHANIGAIELLRPVVRFNVWVHNHTDYPIRLDELSFSDFNPDKAFLFQQWDEDGQLEMPDNIAYRPLPPYSYSDNNNVIDPKSGENPGNKKVYSTLLYENLAPSIYKMFATVTLNPNGANEATSELVSSGAELLSYQTIAAMENNASKQVIMVTPNKTTGGFVGYGDNGLVFYDAKLSFEEFYHSEAESLMRTDDKYELTLNKDSNGQYFVSKGNANLFSRLPLGDMGTTLPDDHLTLASGFAPTSGDYTVPQAFTGYLCRFYGSATINNTQQTCYLTRLLTATDKLSAWYTNNPGGDYMWAFYEIHPKGSPLQLIDNETSQVSQLVRMQRNQEFNVVLNVFHGVTDGLLDFTVESWVGNNTSSHSFN